MKYVALLSGGKDSCFNLLHCHLNGHELVAAASLRPPEGQEEIDSFMYQSVGQDAITLVAQALRVPLYRGYIQGSAIDQSLEYDVPNMNDGEGDETEDLFRLLEDIKRAHPDIEAVSVGAILSNYQRSRVEHVCQRLSLIPLAYLWQRPQGELLMEMIDTGLEAVLIKVAGIGLSSKHLQRSLAELKPHLFNLNERYGAHICGEGGEYETLTLDSPLFHQKIELKETEVVTHVDSGFASVYFLRIRKAELVDKVGSLPDLQMLKERITPHSLDEFGACIRGLLGGVPSSSGGGPLPGTSLQPLSKLETQFVVKVMKPWICLSNILSPSPPETLSLEQEAEQCFIVVREQLSLHSLRMEDIISINLLLSSMADFTAVNTIYQAHFPSTPPARTCVAVNLPAGRRMSMEALSFNSSSLSKQSLQMRKSLQVRSLSYWAPAVIGPYSQAVMAGGFLFISGQIGLIPSSHSLPNPTTLDLETALAIQHTKRIRETFKSMYSSSDDLHAAGWVVWADTPQNLGVITSCWREKVQESLGEVGKDFASPALFVVAETLPKSAMVEVQATFFQPEAIRDDDEQEDDEFSTPYPLKLRSGRQHLPGIGDIFWEMADLETRTVVVIYMNMAEKESWTGDGSGPGDLLNRRLRSAFSIRLFHTGDSASGTEQLQLLGGSETDTLPITTIPVRYICDRLGKPWDCVAYVQSQSILGTLP